MHARLFGLCAIALLVSACSDSSSIEVTSPSSLKCQVTVANQLQGAAPPAGTSSALTVTTTRDCTWSATSDQPWLSIKSGANGQGSGSISYSIAANAQPQQRKGTIDVNNTAIAVVQDPAPCLFDVTPDNPSVAAGGGAVALTVQVMAGCAWTAQSSASWIAVTSGSSGTGNGTVTIQAAANGGDARSGTVTIGGKSIAVAQSAAACTFTIAPARQEVPDGGGSFSIAVSVRPGCSWTAAASVPWIAIASGGSGNGNSTVAISVAANPGDARSGSISVGGQTITIAQAAAPCNFSFTPPSQNVPSEGASVSVAVAVRPGCAWTAASSVSWIAIASGASGNGNGTVTLSVAPNPGAARSGAVTIGGKTYTVTQAAVPCNFGIAPGAQSFLGEGGTGGTFVSTGPTCAWTAVPNVPWITILSGGSGVGSGAVAFAVAGNPGAARSGTITVAGQTFTVTQAEACSFVLDPTSASFGAVGGTGTVTVTASGPACAWGAASSASWLVVLSGASGNSGSGTVVFAVAPNIGPGRTAQLIIGLKRFDVTQGSP